MPEGCCCKINHDFDVEKFKARRVLLLLLCSGEESVAGTAFFGALAQRIIRVEKTCEYMQDLKKTLDMKKVRVFKNCRRKTRVAAFAVFRAGPKT